MALKDMSCKPAEKGAKPLSLAEARAEAARLNDWKVSENGLWLVRRFVFSDFSQALVLANRIGEIANAQGHHPDLEIGYGYLTCKLQTHDVGGLHANDFILASKIDAIAG